MSPAGWENRRQQKSSTSQVRKTFRRFQKLLPLADAAQRPGSGSRLILLLEASRVWAHLEEAQEGAVGPSLPERVRTAVPQRGSARTCAGPRVQRAAKERERATEEK